MKKGILKRLFSPLSFVSGVLVDGAVKELSAIAKDYLTGTLQILLSLLFFFFFWLSLNVLVAVGFNKFFGLEWFYSILIDMLINLFFSLIFLLTGKSKFDRK